jgi:hypothetical protein
MDESSESESSSDQGLPPDYSRADDAHSETPLLRTSVSELSLAPCNSDPGLSGAMGFEGGGGNEDCEMIDDLEEFDSHTLGSSTELETFYTALETAEHDHDIGGYETPPWDSISLASSSDSECVVCAMSDVGSGRRWEALRQQLEICPLETVILLVGALYLRNIMMNPQRV